MIRDHLSGTLNTQCPILVRSNQHQKEKKPWAEVCSNPPQNALWSSWGLRALIEKPWTRPPRTFGSSIIIACALIYDMIYTIDKIINSWRNAFTWVGEVAQWFWNLCISDCYVVVVFTRRIAVQRNVVHRFIHAFAVGAHCFSLSPGSKRLTHALRTKIWRLQVRAGS